MKQTTKEWLLAAEDDFLSASKLIEDERLTNVVTFHCQQCLEKCFKAVIEEKSIPLIKSHDLIRLSNLAELKFNDSDILILTTINEAYIDSRYPGDFGLLPEGKPTQKEAKGFIAICDKVFHSILKEFG